MRMNILNMLVGFVLVILIISYATGLIIGGGGTGTANKVITWELKQLYKFGRWFLKLTLQGLEKLCRWAHTKL